jgi:cytochrome c oxidase subunit 2
LTSLRRALPRLLPLLLLLGLLALMMSGCETDTPQNTFDAKGEIAEDQRNLFYIAMWPALVIGIGVFVAAFLIVLRFRERDPNALPPQQLHGNTRLEIAWTILPAVFLLVLGIPMVAMIYDQGRAASDDAYTIDVIGQRYSWVFEYPELIDDEGFPVSTINEAHIPAGREVNFRLRSIDVIHSFWVPKLAGKRDVMPCPLATPDPAADPDPLAKPACIGGQLNELWMIAEEPDTFHGQCAEYCGLEHALMRMTIIADSEEDFEAWGDEMLSGGDGGQEEDDGADEEPTATGTGD